MNPRFPLNNFATHRAPASAECAQVRCWKGGEKTELSQQKVRLAHSNASQPDQSQRRLGVACIQSSTSDARRQCPCGICTRATRCPRNHDWRAFRADRCVCASRHADPQSMIQRRSALLRGSALSIPLHSSPPRRSPSPERFGFPNITKARNHSPHAMKPPLVKTPLPPKAKRPEAAPTAPASNGLPHKELPQVTLRSSHQPSNKRKSALSLVSQLREAVASPDLSEARVKASLHRFAASIAAPLVARSGIPGFRRLSIPEIRARLIRYDLETVCDVLAGSLGQMEMGGAL